MNPFLITDTYTLMKAVEQIEKPASYLVDVFFPQVMPVSYTKYVSVEYRKKGRRLAPYVVPGARGVNMSREGSRVANYAAPLMACRRVISLNDIEQRMFGEMPVFTTLTPEDRAAQLQAEDLKDLLGMAQNRLNQQAASILQTGKAIIRGYADDGVNVQIDEIAFDFDGVTTKDWTNANADIYGDLRTASEKIQEESGYVPTLMVIGKNVEKYLLNNKAIKDWLMVANRQNLSMMSFEPHYTSPQVRFIGYISALNLEIVSYAETYVDDATGAVKPFIDADTVIIGKPELGRQLYGAVSYLDQNGGWNTAAAQQVPVYNFNADAQTSSLTLFSRCLLVPEVLGSWQTLKVAS